MAKKLHPSVQKFKEFVKNNPRLIQEVRNGNATWQELYEDWYLLGEDDKRWEHLGVKTNSETEKVKDNEKVDWMSNVVGTIKKMDANQVQHHINNLSQAIGAIQGVLSSFQGGNAGSAAPAKPPEGPKNPFSFRKD